MPFGIGMVVKLNVFHYDAEMGVIYICTLVVWGRCTTICLNLEIRTLPYLKCDKMHLHSRVL